MAVDDVFRYYTPIYSAKRLWVLRTLVRVWTQVIFTVFMFQVPTLMRQLIETMRLVGVWDDGESPAGSSASTSGESSSDDVPTSGAKLADALTDCAALAPDHNLLLPTKQQRSKEQRQSRARQMPALG